jgi:hypothetical protein
VPLPSVAGTETALLTQVPLCVTLATCRPLLGILEREPSEIGPPQVTVFVTVVC